MFSVHVKYFVKFIKRLKCQKFIKRRAFYVKYQMLDQQVINGMST